MNPELQEYIRQIELRRSVLIRNLGVTVIGRTLEFAEDAIRSLGEISVDEWKDAVERVFHEEMRKL